jgi:hypothetical protein
MQENREKDLIRLLELPGLNDLIQGYNKSNITVFLTNYNKQNLNPKQLLIKSNENEEYFNNNYGYERDFIDSVFCYGNTTLNNPKYLFSHSDIKDFKTKGGIV